MRPHIVLRIVVSIAFFERVEVMSTRDGDKILPIEYSDNYVTVFPG